MERNVLLMNGVMTAVRLECPMKKQHICLTAAIQKHMECRIRAHPDIISLYGIIPRKELGSNAKLIMCYFGICFSPIMTSSSRTKNEGRWIMRKTAVLGMLFLFTALLFSGCSRQHRMIKKLQDAIVQEQPEDFKITVYFLSPWFMVNRAISVEEMLTFEEELEVFHLSGQEAYNSVQIIRECLQEDMIEPVKQSGCMNARLYYVLENKVEEKILEIIVYANDKEFNDYKYIRYNDDNKTVICNSKNAVINKFELKDEKNVIIVLKDGEEKIAEVVK